MTIPCWIICSPRCGSTYLCDLLNKTKLFDPEFSEYFNAELKKPDLLPNCKIQPAQWIANKLNVQTIIDKFPQIKFIRISRKNFLDRAASFYLANEINIWLVDTFPINPELDHFRKEKNIYLNKKIKINEENIKRNTLSLINELQNENIIVKEIKKMKPIMEISYEQITNNTNKILNQIVHYLGNSNCFDIKSTMQPMPKRQEKDQIKKIIKKYAIKLL